MDVEEALEVVRRSTHAVMATRRADGTPQMSPVTAVVDGEGRVVVSSRESAVKVRNLRRHPEAWLCCFPERFYGTWVQVSGRVEVVSLPEAMDGLVDYYRRAAGEHTDWADYRRAMATEQRCLLRMAVERAGPDVSG